MPIDSAQGLSPKSLNRPDGRLFGHFLFPILPFFVEWVDRPLGQSSPHHQEDEARRDELVDFSGPSSFYPPILNVSDP